MQICNLGHTFDYETEKVMRIFFPFSKINIVHEKTGDSDLAVCEIVDNGQSAEAKVRVNIGLKTENESEVISPADNKAKELALGRCLYRCLSRVTGYKSEWGILTGIRPAKLFSHIAANAGESAARESFRNLYLAADSKIDICAKTSKSESQIISLSRPDSFSLYVSVPFCPSRCSYCSFVSHSVENAKNIIPEYLRLLALELGEAGRIVRRLNLRLETVYVGGGTPTALSAGQLEELLFCIKDNFDFSAMREFTVEAGRPDTVDIEKLSVIKSAGATRISINPQSMNDDVLISIGRRHTAEQMRKAFYLAREAGFCNINTDIIAGLKSDTLDSFKNTVEEILALSPESVTVHSLCVKRAADISRRGELPDPKEGLIAEQMVDFAAKTLEQNGLLPYYMYRQSKTVGNLENVGYAKQGFEGLYNVYIMDETHTVVACGASAVTKLKEPRGNNIERIFNFKYPYEYIGRFGEIMKRKQGIESYYGKYPVF